MGSSMALRKSPGSPPIIGDAEALLLVPVLVPLFWLARNRLRTSAIPYTATEPINASANSSSSVNDADDDTESSAGWTEFTTADAFEFVVLGSVSGSVTLAHASTSSCSCCSVGGSQSVFLPFEAEAEIRNF
jgi:hypothetical protein